MRILINMQDTRTNGEDFAITPFLFGVWHNGSPIKLYGIGLCWGFYAVGISIGINVPEKYPTFKTFKP